MLRKEFLQKIGLVKPFEMVLNIEPNDFEKKFKKLIGQDTIFTEKNNSSKYKHNYSGFIESNTFKLSDLYGNIEGSYHQENQKTKIYAELTSYKPEYVQRIIFNIVAIAGFMLFFVFSNDIKIHPTIFFMLFGGVFCLLVLAYFNLRNNLKHSIHSLKRNLYFLTKNSNEGIINEHLEDQSFLEGKKLSDRFTMAFNIEKIDFIKQFDKTTTKSLFPIISNTFSRKPYYYAGRIINDEFSIKSLNGQGRARGRIYKKEDKLIIETTANGFSFGYIPYYSIVLFVYLIFFTFTIASGSYILLLFILVHAGFLLISPYFILKKHSQATEYDLEREFYYMTKQD